MTNNVWVKKIEDREAELYKDGVVDGKTAWTGSVLTSHGHDLYGSGKLPKCLLDKALATSYTELDGKLVFSPAKCGSQSETAVKFKGKFQEAQATSNHKYRGILHGLQAGVPNSNGNIYTKEAIDKAFSGWQGAQGVQGSQGCTGPVGCVGSQGAQGEAGIPHVVSMSSKCSDVPSPITVDWGTPPVLSCTITIPGPDPLPVHERWQAPTQDEDIYLPIRPQQPKLMEDAMVVYNLGRGQEPKNVEVDDLTYFKNKMFAALQMPSAVSKKLASVDVRFARQYERETGESISNWRQLSSKECKKPVEPQTVGVSMTPAFTIGGSSLSMPDVPTNVMTSHAQHTGSVTIGTSLSMPDVPTNMTISDTFQYSGNVTIGDGLQFAEGRVFYIDIGTQEPQKAEAFMERLKDEFKKRAKEKLESKDDCWFAANGLNRGQVPGIADVFADVAVDSYKAVEPWNQPGVGNWN